MNEPIIYAQNLFRGVNPHLQSILQTPSSGAEDVDDSMVWPSFHSDHITHFGDFLNRVLPSRYIARTEKSLQIRAEDDELLPRKYHPEPDVSIYRKAAPVIPTNTQLSPGMVTLEKPLESTLDLTEDFIGAVVIRDAQEHRRLGPPIVRIELISPTNKPGYTAYKAYRKSRNDVLHSGIPLVEVDYIHELAPTMLDVPRYPRDSDSHAYNIYVSDPRPSLKQGRLRIYSFDTDMPFPIVELPLIGDETLAFDFGAIYHYTYETGRWGSMVDYRLLPERFETYSPADQARIQARMAAITQMQTAEDS